MKTILSTGQILVALGVLVCAGACEDSDPYIAWNDGGPPDASVDVYIAWNDGAFQPDAITNSDAGGLPDVIDLDGDPPIPDGGPPDADTP